MRVTIPFDSHVNQTVSRPACFLTTPCALIRLLKANPPRCDQHKDNTMRASLIILSCSLAAVTAMPTHAQNAQSVRLGEVALTFAAGSIRQEMPLDGVVNVI